MPGQTAGWDRLRLRLVSAAPPLYPPAPRPAGSPAADCEVCRGPVRPGFARCYQCDRHGLLGPALLADVVVPISYAIKGTPFADDLRRYKSAPVPSSSAPTASSAVTPALVPTPASARASVLALLLAFVTDHGPCVWQRVLLLDDTWVSGASAQSAAAALRLAGARHVAVIVLGRHVNPDDAASARLLTGLAAARYDPSACAVHPPSNGINLRYSGLIGS